MPGIKEVNSGSKETFISKAGTKITSNTCIISMLALGILGTAAFCYAGLCVLSDFGILGNSDFVVSVFGAMDSPPALKYIILGVSVAVGTVGLIVGGGGASYRIIYRNMFRNDDNKSISSDNESDETPAKPVNIVYIEPA